MEWDFSPGDGTAIDAGLETAVATAKETIVIATMVLTSKTVMSALVTAISNGIKVSGIYDSGQMGPIEREWAKSSNSAQVLTDWKTVKKQFIAKKSAPYTDTSPHDFMHNKILIADKDLITGSYNFSANAEKNAENQLHITKNDALVSEYLAYISAVLKAYRAT